MSPNLVEHLTAFIAVAETGSFTIAARNLNRGVSSISYSLAQLETHCGFSLLDRGSKQSELTERGRALFAEAKAVVERARRFASHAASLEKGNETRIRIAVDVIFPLATLHAALKPFVQTHERVRLQLFTSSLNSLWEELRSGEVDFGLSLLAAIPLDMEGRSFSQITLSPVATANHPLAQLEQPLSLADFQRERQIYYVGSPEIDMERVGRVVQLGCVDGQRPGAHPPDGPQRLRLVLRLRSLLCGGAARWHGTHAPLQRRAAASHPHHRCRMADGPPAGSTRPRAYRSGRGCSERHDKQPNKFAPWVWNGLNI